MTNLGKQHTKDHLRRLFPFLSREFRQLGADELSDESTFAELFGDDEQYQEHYLKAIYEYQR